jgi:rhomboid protease GluP
MCRSCGAIVGAGENQCAVCGASTSSQPAPAVRHRPPDRETIKFARAVLNRPNKFTIIFLVANLFVFLLMWESSGMTSTILWQGFPGPVLEAYGAKLNHLIDSPNRQWWRFIAPMFLHGNLIHLLLNMYALMMIGPFVEKLYGSAKFVVFWVLTGICGVVGSYLAVRPQLATNSLARFIFKAHDDPSVGASGALFGLVGVLFVFGIKFRHELPEGFKRAFGTGLLPIIFINLFIGFVGRGLIDNAAHLGGLLSGAVLALGVGYQRPGVRRAITGAWRVLLIIAVSIVIVAFYKVGRNFNRPVVPVASVVQNPNRVIYLNYVAAMTQVQEKVSAVIHKNDTTDVAVITERVMQVSVPDARAAELRNSLLAILSKLADATAKASPSPKDGSAQVVKLDEAEFKKWQKEYNEWLKGAAKTHTAAQ